MASRTPKVHRLGLSRLVVEGNLQPIVRVATLSFKDEKPDKQIMQVHIDGQTLATWDLILLRQRKLAGSDKFFTITEQKMLQLTLPLFEPGGQKVAAMKTIQLFILIAKDFYTAVDYLSTKAGMQHCHINQVLQNLRGVSVPRPALISRTRESIDMSSIMRPPTASLIRRPTRPQSQSSVHAPVKHSPLEPVHRPQTARPNLTRPSGMHSWNQSTAISTIPIGRRPSSQEDRYWSIPPVGHLERRNSLVPGDSDHPRKLFGTGAGGGNPVERRSPHHQPVHLGSMGSHRPSDPLQFDPWGPPPSNPRAGTDFGNVPHGPYHGRFAGRPASKSGRTLPLPRRTMSTTAYPLAGHPASQPPTQRPTSRSSTISDRGVPIMIQVLGFPDGSNYSSLHSKIRWEFTLHLLPTTKIWELCLHAASYIRRMYGTTVDGRTLAAQSMDGTPLEDQDILSDETLETETIRLVERKLNESHAASPQASFPHVSDEADWLPPPRQLPFRVVSRPVPPRSSSSAGPGAPRSPLSERPDLKNADPRSPPNQTLGQAVSQDPGKKAPASKQPQNIQKPKPPITTTRRPASSANGRRLDLVSETATLPEPRAAAKRPGTSLGIRSKRKAPSDDGAVPTAVPPVVGPILSDNDDSTKQLATRSCMGCRNKKRKCDRSQPACGPCLKDKRPCTYPNTPKAAATGPRSEPEFDTVTRPLVPRNQVLVPPPMFSDASAQVNLSNYRDIGSQTEAIAHENQAVEMKDACSTNQRTDASTETDKCDDLWVPFSQCAQLVLWAGNQYEKKVQKAAEILSTTGPLQDDFEDKVARAAVYALEFENEFREKYEQTLGT